MRITVYPQPTLDKYGIFRLTRSRTGFEFRLTEETEDGKKEKDFWLKAWRLRRAMQFFTNAMMSIAYGTGMMTVPFPMGLPEEKQHALRKAVEDLKLWEQEQS